MLDQCTTTNRWEELPAALRMVAMYTPARIAVVEITVDPPDIGERITVRPAGWQALYSTEC